MVGEKWTVFCFLNTKQSYLGSYENYIFYGKYCHRVFCCTLLVYVVKNSYVKLPPSDREKRRNGQFTFVNQIFFYTF